MTVKDKAVEYRAHDIALQPAEDGKWMYRVSHTSTITLCQTMPDYDEALAAAKADIDILTETVEERNARSAKGSADAERLLARVFVDSDDDE